MSFWCREPKNWELPAKLPPQTADKEQNYWPPVPRPLPKPPTLPGSMADNIAQAEKRIAAILSELERRGESLVEAIWIESTDVTKIDSKTQILAQRVHIKMRPTPGTQWDVT